MPEYSDEALIRLEKREKMLKMWVSPYANKYDRKHTIEDLQVPLEKSFREIEPIIAKPKRDYMTAWRLILYRSHWKLAFWKIQDGTWVIQIMFHKSHCFIDVKWKALETVWEKDDEMTAYKFMEKMVDIGDFIGLKWELFITHKGERTLFVSEFTFLAKAIRPLPEKFHWVNDKEILYRQRYLDLIANEDTYALFKFRSKFTQILRQFYWENGFTEIETPVLWNSASWAAAKPFITHHEDFDMDVYLHISPETALKMATVWRFEKVFEIARDFRNEGTDPSHLQEFTMVEHYAVYWNYKENIKFTEEMIDYIFDKMQLPRKIKIKDKEWIDKEVNFETPFDRIDYIDRIKRDSWIDITKYSVDDAVVLRKEIKNKWIEFEGMDVMGTTTLIDYLFKKVSRPKILGPAFVYNYPKTMQPLARISDENNNIVEQFQLIINWWEILKAYSELVDPVIQRDNFKWQESALKGWDEEATSGDDDFVLAMEYWMPPQSWLGFWIDRFLTLILWQDNIRDTVLFPLMKPEWGWKSEMTKALGKKEVTSIVQAGDPWDSYAWLKLPSIEKADLLIKKYSSSTAFHLRSVGIVMRYFAKKLGANEDAWQLVWMLHDIDWDVVEKDWDRHLWPDLDKIVMEIGLPEELIADIRSHGCFLPHIEEQPDTPIRKYICSVDELTGFISAVVRVMPNKKLEEVKIKSVKKKIKDKTFARWVDRTEVKNCENMLWIPLDEFIADIIESLKPHAEELGI